MPGLQLTNLTPVGGNAPSSSPRPLAGAGDVNGDGLADVIVGSANAVVRGKGRSGIAYVVFGRRDAKTIDLRRLGSRGFAIEAGESYSCIPDRDDQEFPCYPGGQNVGFIVAGAGDVNGDGLADLVIGTPATQVDDKVRAGTAFVVFGKRSSEPVKLDELGDQGFRIAGTPSRSALGIYVAGLGDASGDGLSDVAVATLAGDPESPSVYVVFGKRDAVDVDVGALGGDGFAISGALAGRNLAPCCYPRTLTLAAAGDISGDGLTDLALGAPGQAPRGRRGAGSVFLIYGRPAGEQIDVRRLGSAGYRIDGWRSGLHLGAELSGAGDFNGDGVPDLVAGGGYQRANPRTPGTVWVVYGKHDESRVDLAELEDGGLALSGRLNRSPSVAGLGDVNGNGLSDVAVGAATYGPRCHPYFGSAFVVFGRERSGSLNLAQLGRGGFRIDGVAPYDDPSALVAGAGDVNGDGRADIIAGRVPGPFDMHALGHPRWAARVLFGRAPMPDEVGRARPPCFRITPLSRNLERVVRDGRIAVRLVSWDSRASRLTVQITSEDRTFFIGRHLRPRRLGSRRVEVPLDIRARAWLEDRSHARLILTAHQLIHREHCAHRLFLAQFAACEGRSRRAHFTLATQE